MTTLEISAGTMLLFSGLWAGAVVAATVERAPIWALMPVDQYVVDFRRSLVRLGPLLAVMGLAAAASAVVFALHSSGAARSFSIAGVAGFVLVVLGSIVFVAPIESAFRRRPEGEIPDGALERRRFWRRFHTGRTLLVLATFACFVAAVLQAV